MKFYKTDKAFYELNYNATVTCAQMPVPTSAHLAYAIGYRSGETASFFTRSHPTKDFAVIGYFVGDDEPVIAVIGEYSQDDLDEFLQVAMYGGDFEQCFKSISGHWFDAVKNKALATIMDL